MIQMMKGLLDFFSFGTLRNLKGKHQPSMVNLPEEITANILSRLPVTSVFTCKCVCKTWYSIIETPHFCDMQLNYFVSRIEDSSSFILVPNPCSSNPNIYIVDEEASSTKCPRFKSLRMNLPSPSPNVSIFLADSSNGFLCLCSLDRLRKCSTFSYCICDPVKSNCSIYIYNPSTRDYVKLPDPSFPCSKSVGISTAFSLDPSSKEFNVVQIFTWTVYTHDSCYSEVQVYSSASKSWKIMGTKMWNSVYQQIIFRGFPLFLNGLFHWVVVNFFGKTVIESFDLVSGQFEIVKGPAAVLDSISDHVLHPQGPGFHLGVLGGCLSLSDSSFYDRLEIWVKKDYNVEVSWTKLFVVRTKFLNRVVSPISFRKNNEVLLLCGFKHLVSYNLKTGKAKLIEDDKLNWKNKLPGCNVSAIPYVGNLVSPKSI